MKPLSVIKHCILSSFIVHLYLISGAAGSALQDEQYDPCCSFPCQNGGVCLSSSHDTYTCDCTGLEFYGDHCEEASLLKRFKQWVRPKPETVQYILTHFSPMWAIINRIPPLRRMIMKYVYLTRGSMVDSPPRYASDHDYVTLEAYYNRSYYARTLPPVPRNCPTPMGVAGKAKLPDAGELVNKFFRRKQFIPDPYKSNVLFASYAQHFTHQFFRTDLTKGPAFTLGSEGADVSHVYGMDVSVQQQLRSFKDGKLKSQMIDGEEYPPNLRDASVPATYPPQVPDHLKFAMGHPFFGLLPGLFVYATIWMREHNRVCDILKQEHPAWDDERLYQTARIILLGETIKITIEEYVQHLSQYKFRLTFEPTLTHGTTFQYSNRIRAEFNHLYHWHPLYPDFHNVSDTIYPLKQVLFNVAPVFKHGLTNFVEAMVQQRAGKLSHHNHGELLMPVLKTAIEQGRTLRFQSFNNYRKRFGLQPYTSFEELTGEKEMSAELEKMYGSIDAVEYIIGLFVEEDGYMVTPRTMVEIGGPYSVKGLMSNPICSPPFWKPSTFGGEVGFRLVNEASLQKLFCENLKGPCPVISFATPTDHYADWAPKEEL